MRRPIALARCFVGRLPRVLIERLARSLPPAPNLILWPDRLTRLVPVSTVCPRRLAGKVRDRDIIGWHGPDSLSSSWVHERAWLGFGFPRTRNSFVGPRNQSILIVPRMPPLTGGPLNPATRLSHGNRRIKIPLPMECRRFPTLARQAGCRPRSGAWCGVHGAATCAEPPAE
jgi:hypothetical protein